MSLVSSITAQERPWNFVRRRRNLTNVLHRSVEITGAKRSFNQARKRYFDRHLPAKSDYWELVSIVQNAEARPLGRKQTFTPRLQGPVYRRQRTMSSERALDGGRVKQIFGYCCTQSVASSYESIAWNRPEGPMRE